MEHKNCLKAQLKSTRFQACMMPGTSFVISVLTSYTHSLKHQKNHHNIDLSLITHLTQETENRIVLFCHLNYCFAAFLRLNPLSLLKYSILE